MTEPSAPTAEQCKNQERVDLGNGQSGWACWYPQMGGYVGKAVIVKDEDCHNVYVWHDGDFPFNGDDPWRETPNPRILHHCDGSQFIAFGELLVGIERHGQP